MTAITRPLNAIRRAQMERRRADAELRRAVRFAVDQGYTYRQLSQATGLSLGWLHTLAHDRRAA